MDISGNRLQLDVRPGNYAVWIDAVAPFKDHAYGPIDLYDNSTIELGNIQLLQ
jgi:hypothetical protein